MVRGWPAFKRVTPILWLMLYWPDLDLLGPYRQQVLRRRPDPRHFDRWPFPGVSDALPWHRDCG
jgi:hypothetical protein